MIKNKLKADFIQIYGEREEDIRFYFSPGRVNLIGEHIDYNGGFVFPCALDIGTYLAIRKRPDNEVHFATLNFPLTTHFKLSETIHNDMKHGWSNYPKGIIKAFLDLNIELSGMDLLYFGNIPNGSGLSSSASIEVVTAFALNDLFHGRLGLLSLVEMAQDTECDFIGVKCGIMDQFAVAFGKEKSAILLNCDTLDYVYVPLNLDGYRIVICNTNKQRGLGDSKYNERTQECESALKGLQKALEINYLCDITPEIFEAHKGFIDQAIPLNRATHAIYENDRVKKAVEALKENNLEAFGQLMTASHYSLKNLYEVSCFELDVMVEEALKIKGTIGARMTGAGFGGCTVNIVSDAFIDEFKSSVSAHYLERTGLKADITIASVGDGVKII
ncbi:MAG: galactokinase [Firmicutes bacterium HGW-Firmicutes-7]|nr:MAG: galactokinase [Firmicutes bacterium HGW-Firmicutes-7]